MRLIDCHVPVEWPKAKTHEVDTTPMECGLIEVFGQRYAFDPVTFQAWVLEPGEAVPLTPPKRVVCHEYEPLLPYECNLIMNDGCNMACDYCYLQGDKLDGTMTVETYAKALPHLGDARIPIHLRSPKYTDDPTFIPRPMFKLTFAETEPLLNFDLMKDIVSHPSLANPDQDLRMLVVTNGTLITQEVADWVGSLPPHILVVFAVSLDGPKYLHDLHKHVSWIPPELEVVGKTAYDYTVEGLNRLQPKFFIINSRFTKDLPAILDRYSYLHNLCEQGHPEMLAFSFQPVTLEDCYPSNAPTDLAFTTKQELDVIDPEMLQVFTYIAQRLQAGEGLHWGELRIMLLRLIWRQRLSTVCVGGAGGIFVSPSGEFVTCVRHQRTLGNVDDGIDWEAWQQWVHECKQAVHPHIVGCWAAPLIPHCPAFTTIHGLGPCGIRCAFQQKILGGALWLLDNYLQETLDAVLPVEQIPDDENPLTHGVWFDDERIHTANVAESG